MVEKGERIRIIGGANMGKKAWKNLEKDETKHYYHIFLKNGDKEIRTKVKKANCRAVHNEKPKTYAEAVM